jgi:hypothetical protein
MFAIPRSLEKEKIVLGKEAQMMYGNNAANMCDKLQFLNNFSKHILKQKR